MWWPSSPSDRPRWRTCTCAGCSPEMTTSERWMMRALWRSYRLLFRWQFLRFRSFLPLLVIIQVSLGIGVVYGLALLVPHIDHDSALYLATGAPTLALILLGLNIVPGEVSQGRLTGRYDYIVSLPVPRLAPVAAEVTFWLAIQLPGTVLALVVAALRFHVSLHIGWMVLPAVGAFWVASAAVWLRLAGVGQAPAGDTVRSPFALLYPHLR